MKASIVHDGATIAMVLIPESREEQDQLHDVFMRAGTKEAEFNQDDTPDGWEADASVYGESDRAVYTAGALDSGEVTYKTYDGVHVSSDVEIRLWRKRHQEG